VACRIAVRNSCGKLIHCSYQEQLDKKKFKENESRIGEARSGRPRIGEGAVTVVQEAFKRSSQKWVLSASAEFCILMTVHLEIMCVMKPNCCNIVYIFSLLSHYTSTCFGLACSPSSGSKNVYMWQSVRVVRRTVGGPTVRLRRTTRTNCHTHTHTHTHIYIYICIYCYLLMM
jgi:hypothetical protein